MKKEEEGRGAEREFIKGSKRAIGSPLSFGMLTVGDTEDGMLRRRAEPSKLPCNTNEAGSISKPKPQHDITSLFFLILRSFTTNHRNQKHYLHLPWDFHDFKGQRETLFHHSPFNRFFAVKH